MTGLAQKMLRPLLVAAVIAAAAQWPAVAHADSADPETAARSGQLVLTVRVADLKSDDGLIHIGVWNAPEHFPDREGRIFKHQISPANREAVFTVAGLRPGNYAVAVFHDENGNGEFDQGLFGIPLEGYGFSNGARPFLSAPDFEDAAIEVGADTEAVVTLSY